MDKRQAAVCMGTPAGSGKAGRTGGGTGAGFCVDFFCGSFDRHWSVLWDLDWTGAAGSAGNAAWGGSACGADGSPTMSMTEPPTQPATEPPTQPATEATEPATEPETEPATEPPTEPQPEEPAVDTAPPATDPPASDGEFAVTGYILPNSKAQNISPGRITPRSPVGSWCWRAMRSLPAMAADSKTRTFRLISTAAAGMRGTIAPEDFDTSVMNDVEVQNVWTLKAAEG